MYQRKDRPSDIHEGRGPAGGASGPREQDPKKECGTIRAYSPGACLGRLVGFIAGPVFIALLLCVLCPLTAVAAPGNHFILLLDDSGDMRGYAGLMAEHLPEYLFSGSPPGSSNRRPPFNPHQDTLSIVYFGI